MKQSHLVRTVSYSTEKVSKRLLRLIVPKVEFQRTIMVVLESEPVFDMSLI